MKRYKQLALGTAALSVLLTSCDHTSEKVRAASVDTVPVRAVRASSQDVPLEISAVGNVEAAVSVDVKSRIAGQVTRVAFQEGQSVAKGQILFFIDRSTLERQAAEQQAQLQRDSAMEQQARAVVARDTAAHKQSLSEAQVALQLGKMGVLSQQRVDQLQTVSDTAHAALSSDQASVDAAISNSRADRARLAQTQLQMNFTEIIAPVSGRAGAVMIKAGNMVRDNDTTLVTLRQLAPIHVVFGIPEQSLPQVQRLYAAGELAVEAALDNAQSFTGRLIFIDNTVDATTGAIRLKAIFPNTDNALWPGEFVHVRLRLGIDKAQTIVPSSSIQDGADGKYIWLIRSGIAGVAPVQVQRTYRPHNGSEQALISTGIRPGDLVVTEGQLRLTPGAHITLLN